MDFPQNSVKESVERMNDKVQLVEEVTRKKK